MTQLLLGLGPVPAPTFANFVVGPNAEALAALRRLCAAPVADPSMRGLYLWGDVGSGRSHLLRAAAAAVGGDYLAAGDASEANITARVMAQDSASIDRWMLAIDDVQKLDAAAQVALFHAINAMREDPRAAIVVAGDAAPRDLALAPGRDDLRSRLAWGLCYQLQALDDDAKNHALAQNAAGRGFSLSPEVRGYLLTHFSRDLGSLMRLVDALDRHALEHHRPITVPLVRDFLQQTIAFKEALGHAA